MVRTREQKKNDPMAPTVSPGNKKKKNKKKTFNKPHPFQGIPFFGRNKKRNNNHNNRNSQRYYNDERSEQDLNHFFVMRCISCNKSTVIERTANIGSGDRTLPLKCSDCELRNKHIHFSSESKSNDQIAINSSEVFQTPSRSNRKSDTGNQPNTLKSNAGNQPNSYKNNVGNQPNSYNSNAGNQPNSFKSNAGNQPNSFKSNAGNQPNSFKSNAGNQPNSYKSNAGNQPKSFKSSAGYEPNTLQIHGKVIQWLLQPHPVKEFFRDYWEKKPLLMRRSNPKYYSRVINLNTATVDQVLCDNALFFTKHVDITSYTDGVRETHNPEGRALPHIVWDMYRNGCSVRFLNPQAFIPSIHKLNSELQEKMGFVGCNLYLTPAGSQGFAPHYDDIEAFVLQIEGSKHWKVYPPSSESETLPRYSSKNLSEADLGPPIIDCVLRPGDLLYFPRGFVHQAKTTDEHSLHITLSAYQCTAYIDMFEKVLPNVLKEAACKSVKFRDGLPLNYAHTFGITRNPRYSEVRTIMTDRLKEMLHDMVENMDFDSAVDQFSAAKLHDDLPLYLTEDVKECTVFGNRNTIDPDGRVNKVVQLQLDSKVCLLQLNICRLVQEDERYLLYHSMSNSLEYHERDREFLEVPKDSIEAVKFLFHSYPNYVRVADLPIGDDEGKWSFANTLWENGLLKTDGPLNKISPEEMDDDDDDDGDHGDVNDDNGSGES